MLRLRGEMAQGDQIQRRVFCWQTQGARQLPIVERPDWHGGQPERDRLQQHVLRDVARLEFDAAGGRATRTSSSCAHTRRRSPLPAARL